MKYCYLRNEIAQYPGLIKLLKKGIALPMDRLAMEYCMKYNLDYRVCNVFFDSKTADRISQKVMQVLINCMYDNSIFSDAGIQNNENCRVNPIFISLYQLLTLYVGIILQSYELNKIFSEYSSENYCIIETQSEKSFLYPFLDYTEVLKYYENTDLLKQIASMPTETSTLRKYSKPGNGYRTKRLFNRLRLFMINLKNHKLLFRFKARYYMAGIQQRGAFSIASKIMGNSNLIHFLCGPLNTLPKKIPSKKIISRILPILTHRIYNNLNEYVNYNNLKGIVSYAYDQYSSILESPMAYSNFENIRYRASNKKKKLIIRVYSKAPFRSFVYRKYLEGYKIVSLEYSDGEGGEDAIIKNPYLCCRNAPIADILVYNMESGSKSVVKYMSDIGLKINNTHVIEVDLPYETKSKTKIKNNNGKQGSLINVYYLVNKFGKRNRLGTAPSSEMHDLAYWEWQKKVLFVLKKIRNLRIVYKAHPKNDLKGMCNFQTDYLKEHDIPLANGYLQDILHNIDLIVCDNVGSALWKSYISGKPVIYLNLGLPIIFETNMEILKKDICWIDCNFKSDEWQNDLINAVNIFINKKKSGIKEKNEYKTVNTENHQHVLEIFKKIEQIDLKK